jgi:F0F1-type ATP synthase assembly protein I
MDDGPPPEHGSAKKDPTKRDPTKRDSASKIVGSSMREVSPYLGLGVEITVSMVFFILLGYFADGWLGTSPWLLITGIALSVVATTFTLLRMVREMNAASAAEKARRKREKGRRGGPGVKG